MTKVIAARFRESFAVRAILLAEHATPDKVNCRLRQAFPPLIPERSTQLRRIALGKWRKHFDLGYEPQPVDTWCDDLLDDEVDPGMPMDLVDLYWGPPVDTQQFVEYNAPYEISTYRNAEGDYRQVTSKDRIVSQPMYNGADLNNR